MKLITLLQSLQPIAIDDDGIIYNVKRPLLSALKYSNYVEVTVLHTDEIVFEMVVENEIIGFSTYTDPTVLDLHNFVLHVQEGLDRGDEYIETMEELENRLILDDEFFDRVRESAKGVAQEISKATANLQQLSKTLPPYERGININNTIV